MTDLNKGEQRDGANTGGISHPSGGNAGENNRDAEFGTEERATRGTDRDLDESGVSKNQGHGHPREERNSRHG